MELVKQLPTDIRNRIFLYFRSNTARLIKIHFSPRGKLMEDIRDYHNSLKKLYNLPFAKDHDGKWGRARLVNSLWMYTNELLGNYYSIWTRMYRIDHERKAEWWTRWRYAANFHEFQINSLWALLTKDERKKYFKSNFFYKGIMYEV